MTPAEFPWAVLMPSRRWWNWRTVGENLLAVRAASGSAYPRWVLIVTPEDLGAAPADVRDFVFGTCQAQVVLSFPMDYNPISHKLNAGLAALRSAAWSGWCYTGADDDLLPVRLGSKLAAAVSRQPDALALACSLHRGQHSVAADAYGGAYPTWPLIAAPENMKVCAVSASQVLLHTDWLYGQIFADHPCADGMMIEAAHRQHPGRFAFLREVWLPFNALQRERWDADALRAIVEAE